jgi:hypothetical protein
LLSFRRIGQRISSISLDPIAAGSQAKPVKALAPWLTPGNNIVDGVEIEAKL